MIACSKKDSKSSNKTLEYYSLKNSPTNPKTNGVLRLDKNYLVNTKVN